MMTSPRAEGPIAAIAGRSIPATVLRLILASASSAPVLPAETTPSASPLATVSMASRMEESRTRSAAVGFMSLEIADGACRTVQHPPSALRAASMGVSCASSPTSRNRAPG